jgi:hypothetical protein
MRCAMTEIKSDPGAPEKIYHHGWDLGDLADPQEGMVRPLTTYPTGLYWD